MKSGHVSKDAACRFCQCPYFNKNAAGDEGMPLQQAMQIMSQLAKAHAELDTRIAAITKEVEAKYHTQDLAAQAPVAAERVKAGLDELKTAQRKFGGVLFRLREVTHRKSFKPSMFKELIHNLFKGQDEIQVQLNQLEEQATTPQSKSMELETVVQPEAFEEPAAPAIPKAEQPRTASLQGVARTAKVNTVDIKKAEFDMDTYIAGVSEAGKLAQAAGYGIDGYQQMETPSGVAFSGKLTKGGAEVGSFQQDGRGGMTDFNWTDPAAQKDFASYGKGDEDTALLGLLELAGV
jgi:hypothetical protein